MVMRKETLRRRTAWCALVGYVLVASGLPLPFGSPPGAGGEAAAKRLAVKDRAQPFPCMDKPCGCATAEQCFTNCCCHTPAETLAWARGHRVAAHVLAALERRVAAPAAGVSCCAARARPACCAEQAACCSAAAPAVTPAPASAPPAAPRVVSLRAMLACGGIIAQWSAVAAAPPPPRVASPWRLAPLGAVMPAADETADAIRPVPEPPPPRAA